MKIIFFEVRSKTHLYNAISKKLKQNLANLEVIWIIQNKAFSPKTEDKKYHLAFPDHTNKKYVDFDFIDKKVFDSDRFSLHLDTEPTHYKHYRAQIENIFDTEKPDFVFGELGNFFTHYGALLAKEKNIPFYDIETARLPNQCIGFFKYDKWEPLKLRDITDQEVEAFLDHYIARRPVPDYMSRKDSLTSKLKLSSRRALHRMKVLGAYVCGERYCTQEPIRNALDKKNVSCKLSIWDSNSIGVEKIQDLKASGRKFLLYPLQMQPELNIEVWGHPHSNQEKLIQLLAAKIPSNWILLIKANPKPFFELNRININKILQNNNVFLVDRSITMPELTKHISIVSTVTGTIQIERLLLNMPVHIIGKTPFQKYSCMRNDLNNLCAPDFALGENFRLSDAQVKDVARYLLEHSTPGLMGEPINSLQCMKDSNIDLLARALFNVISNNTQ